MTYRNDYNYFNKSNTTNERSPHVMEKLFKAQFEDKFDELRYTTKQEDLSGIDFIGIQKEKTRKYQIKACPISHLYGGEFAVEVYESLKRMPHEDAVKIVNKDGKYSTVRSSGINKCASEWWVFVDKDNWYFIKTEKIREYLREYRHQLKGKLTSAKTSAANKSDGRCYIHTYSYYLTRSILEEISTTIVPIELKNPKDRASLKAYIKRKETKYLNWR